MLSRRALGVITCLSLLPITPRADDQGVVGTVQSDQPPPSTYAKLTWQGKIGVWYPADQVFALSKRLDYLETKAAKDCVDAQIQADKHLSTWIYVGLGLLSGAATAYCATVSGHCGLYK